jgi:hypothetical protein
MDRTAGRRQGRRVMAARPILSLKPARNPDVQLAAAVLRCRRCSFQWSAALTEWLDVQESDARCPNCTRRSPEPPAAA